ncbi:hypothetical protein E3P99_00957 [Wallemia hederae]|uniref:Uncharacterized protein n=1 Tax=Wallemia hederae TaxID=1540922 RepID=A0A4T0FV64_9BASI|nr:hypothetical protein E3P99_00957 [Wallemia hederae]
MITEIKVASSTEFSSGEAVQAFIDNVNESDNAAAVISRLGPFFDCSEPWSSEQLSRNVLVSVQNLLENRSGNTIDTVQSVIFNHVKPYFTTQHKSVNTDTGRVRMRELASEHTDTIDTPPWKTQAYGIWGTLALLMSLADISKCWFMFLPPTMSMLDDHEPFFKLRGVKLLRTLIDALDAKTIQQAGLRTLWEGSLSTSLTFFAQEHGAELLVCTTEAMLALYRKSPADVNSLYKLTMESVIQPWFYAGDKLSVLLPTFTVLPQLLEAMGVYSARFLKAIIPQINRTLLSVSPPSQHSLPSQLAALNSLDTLIRVCDVRLQQRRVQILDGLVKSYVKADGNAEYAREYTRKLQSCYSTLKKAVPQVPNDLDALIRAYPPLKALDVDLA